MLNIPASVKTLFKTDGTRKNFRVHFPNGEYSDITNDHVVVESVRFTESLCSQTVFKFGLAENSVIEFETVGAGNMYGMTIEASIEIDTTSLSAAEISTIQSGTWDGTLVLAADSDIGFGFFRVPLGTFRVESCPRNHGAMTHRQVTAYSVGLPNFPSPYEVFKWKALSSNPTNTYYSIDSVILANIGYYTPSIVSNYFSKTEITATGTGSGTRDYPYLLSGGILVFRYEYQTAKTKSLSANVNADTLFSVEIDDFDNSTAIAWLKTTLTGIGHAEMVDILVNATRDTNYPLFINAGYYKVTKDLPIALLSPEKNSLLVRCPTKVKLILSWTPTGSPEQVYNDTFTLSASNPFKLYKLSYLSPPLSLPCALKSTGQATAAGVTYYTYFGSYSLTELIVGWLEIRGVFGQTDRNGEFKTVTLDNSSPVSIITGNYGSVWWDEYDVAPVGTVKATFTNDVDGEGTFAIEIGDGGSVYDMSDNAVLKDAANMDEATVQTLLSGDFKTNVAKVGFTPAEMVMQGWPWIEAGDALEITAEDGTIVDTYALRVEMSGIQNLSSQITAPSGEITWEG